MNYSETSVSHLRQLLDERVVRFQFKKLDGSMREALGTRQELLIPKAVAPKYIDDISKKSVVFWDLEEEAFRSFSVGTQVATL
jgi:hypothetical protein